MNGMRRFAGFLITALTLAAVSLPAGAAPAKIFGLLMAPATVTTTTTNLTATFSNQTPNGNSVINTVILTPPSGVTVNSTSFPNGGSRVTCPATTVNSSGQVVPVPANSVCVANIPSVMKAGCTPTACSWTFNLNATLPNSCGVNTWAGQAFAGNSFNGDVFALVTNGTSLTTTINAGCTYAINTTVSPAGSGTLVCSPNPVSFGGSSTCTATAGAGYAFSSFSGDCSGSTCTLTNVQSVKNVTANFTHLPVTVTTAVNPAGTGTLTCSPASPVPYGSPMTCTATPAAGYGLVNFSGDCSGTSCSFASVTAPLSITANFAQNAITAVASPAAGGSVSCTPNPVPYGGNSTCTATTNALYTFTGFTGTCTSSGATCTYTGVTTAQNLTANYVSNTLSIVSAPSSAAVGTPFDVVIGSTPTGATVSFSAGCDASATKTVLGDGSTDFKITVNTLPAPPSTCTITFTATNYNPISLNNFQVYKGVLYCGDYDSINGPGDKSYDPDAPSTISGLGSSYVGTPGWGLRRGPNKDGAACVKVNYSCNMDTTKDPAIVTCTWDKSVVPPQQATFKYLFLWPAKAPDANGWTSYRPQVTWPPAVPDATYAFPNWAPLVNCVSDQFSTPPTWILPTIPNTAPFSTDSNNTLPQYQPGAVAWVCGAQQGWTAVGAAGTAPGNGNPLVQVWNIVIDEADLQVRGP